MAKSTAAANRELLSETLSGLRSLKQSVTREDLEKPTCAFLVRIYDFFLAELTGRQGSLSQLAFNAFNNVFEHPELHETSALLFTIALSMDSILDDTGFSEGFCISDLTYPSSGKTVRVFNHLIKVHQSRQDRTPFVNKLFEKINDTANERQRLKRENEVLKERINMARVRLAEAQPQIKMLRERDEQMFETLQKTEADAVAMEKRSEKLTEDTQKAEATYKKSLEERERLRQDIQRFDAQIVSSPDRLRNDLKQLELEKDGLVKEIDELNAAASASNDRKSEFGRIDSLLNSVISPLEEVMGEKEKLDALRQDCQKLEEEYNSLHMSVQSMIVKNNGKRKVLDSREQQLNKLEAETEARMEDVRKDIDRLKRNLDAVEHEKRQNDLASSELDKRCDAIRHELADLDKQYIAYKQQVLAALQELKAASTERNQRGREFIQAVNGEIRKDLKK